MMSLQFVAVRQGIATSAKFRWCPPHLVIISDQRKRDIALEAASLKTIKPGRHPDGRYGLYFNVIGNSRTWVQRLTIDGKRRNFGLGPWALGRGPWSACPKRATSPSRTCASAIAASTRSPSASGPRQCRHSRRRSMRTSRFARGVCRATISNTSSHRATGRRPWDCGIAPSCCSSPGSPCVPAMSPNGNI